MSRLNPEKLHVQFAPGTAPDGPVTPRCYTLTHSDATGDLFLTIGPDYDRQQTAGWQTRLMRDEVIAEWRDGAEGPALHLHCHVSGGLVLGQAGMRDAIFRRELPLVLEAFRFGDRRLFEAHPELDQAPIWVHFHATQARYDQTEPWGVPADYRIRSDQECPTCSEASPSASRSPRLSGQSASCASAARWPKGARLALSLAWEPPRPMRSTAAWPGLG